MTDCEKPQETTETDETSKKRKAEKPLSELKRQQLQDARQKKLQKAQDREQQMSEMRSKLTDFETKLKENNQRVTNVEVEKEVHAEMNSPEKKPKIVTSEPQVEKHSVVLKPWFENLLNPETVVRSVALITLGLASFYMKNVWKKPPALAPPPPPPPPKQQAKPKAQPG